MTDPSPELAGSPATVLTARERYKRTLALPAYPEKGDHLALIDAQARAEEAAEQARQEAEAETQSEASPLSTKEQEQTYG
jgi:hypothetical protein